MSTVAVKERPILFSGPMVKAILEGRKTQTRRILKPQPDVLSLRPLSTSECDQHDIEPIKCPYGKPGERLWVRETWAAVHLSTNYETGYVDVWHGSHDIPPGSGDGYWTPMYAADQHEELAEERGWKWRPSIHMPRWASRITLEITGVRCERLHDISEADAMAEGVRCSSPEFDESWGPTYNELPSYKSSFRTLWEAINGKGSWAANPCVWVVSFRRIEHHA